MTNKAHREMKGQGGIQVRSNGISSVYLNSFRCDTCSRLRGPAVPLSILIPFLVLWVVVLMGPAPEAFSQDRVLTVAVLVNSTNSSGYNTSASSPGEFQRYPERYLEHLQVPYEVIDVALQSPPEDLSQRQLIVVGHSGVLLPAAWESAIVSAVAAGTGLMNLDWQQDIGFTEYMQTIFGTTGSYAGTPGTTITVPGSVRPDGENPHFIAAMQLNLPTGAAGDVTYSFHNDADGVLNPVTSTVLGGDIGTTIAQIDSDPFIVAVSYGQGRAVHFGTLEYLKADRFGFLQGIDDLFWRSMVWTARKPFVLRGYPRYWSVQMDDTTPNWGFRVRDMYDTSLTGTMAQDGTGGRWKVTGYLFTDQLPPGGEERASVVTDIQNGVLKVAPHSFNSVTYGNMYWNGSSGQLTDSQWLTSLNGILTWKTGQGGTDAIPSLSRSFVAHYWDLSDNTGYDLWNTLGYRYITTIQKPGYQNNEDVTINNGAERLNARPFWLYELPPKLVMDESYSFFFADDYPVNSRSGLPQETLFLFATQYHPFAFPRADATWPSTFWNLSVSDSLGEFQEYTWRFWSALAPLQIYTHDQNNYNVATTSDRQQVISRMSAWLLEKGVRHIFMENLGDYVYARTKSTLTGATLSGDSITYTFTGTAATYDNKPIPTQLKVFTDGTPEGEDVVVPGFIGDTTVTLPISPMALTIAGITPSTGLIDGGTEVTITGTGFTADTVVTIGGTEAGSIVVESSTAITAVTPPGAAGAVDVVVSNYTGTVTLTNGYTYTAPSGVLFAYDFSGGTSDGWTISPLGNPSGWSVVDGVYTYDGSGHTQSYNGNASWTDYTLDVDFKLSNLLNYPGGIRGRVNSSTGAGYAVWLYPAFNQIRLYRATAWNIDSPGLTLLGTKSGVAFDTAAFHHLRMVFSGIEIQVYYDGVLVIDVTDSTYGSGLIALDVASQPIAFDNVNVTAGTVSPVAPTIGSITPASGSPAGGDAVVLTGTGFIAGTAVTIGGNAATGVTVNSSTNMSAVAPSGTAGTADVVVSNSNGSATLTGGFTYAVSAPAVTQISPNYGPVAGGTQVQITGSGFVAGTTVSIGGAAATGVVINSETSITAVTPAGSAGPVDVVVANSNGSGTLSAGFTYTADNVLFSDNFNDGDANGWTISPLGYASGWSVAGGMYTYNGGGHTQSYNGNTAWTDYTLDVDFQLTNLLNYPGGIRGRVDSSTGAGYAVWLYPASGQIRLFRATAWNIDSSGLALLGTASGVTFTASTSHHLRLVFSGAEIQVYFDGTLLLDVTDAVFGSGLIAFDVSSQSIAFDNVSVTANTTAAQAPTVSGITPGSGSAAGGVAVVITGTGFTSDTTVTIGGNAATGVAVNSTSSIRAVTPAGEMGAADVVVSNANGTATLQGGFTFTADPPTIAQISPNYGPIEGGTQVEIAGSGFVTGTSVTIGGVPAASVSIESTGSISAVAPAGAAGATNVVVTNVNGTATLTNGFTYTTSDSMLFSDDFNDGNAAGWTVSPLGYAVGWSVADGAYTFDGRGHTQSYNGNTAWTDYSFQADFKLSTLNNYPGGIRARVNSSSGAGYAVWLYPTTGRIVLFRATGWNIDSTGLTSLGSAGGIAFDTASSHTVKISCSGTLIDVYYDGQLVVSAVDSTYSGGVIALDVSNQYIQFDNVLVNSIP